MTTISSTTLSSLTGKTTDATKKASETYTQFLTMLTTQLQNQDPLDPTDSNEFTNQLVQFSQVEQQILGNEKLDALLTQNSNNQIGQSLSYIGKDIYYKGDSAYFDGTKSLKFGYAIDGEAEISALHIYDSNEQLVKTLTDPAGTTSGSVTWDGTDNDGNTLAAGTYTLVLDALDADGAAVDTYTGVPGHVDGVETVDGVLYLALTGDTRVDATSVLSISDPDTTTTTTGTTS